MFEWHGYGRAYPPGDGRSSAPSFISATRNSTDASTTPSASVSARCGRPADPDQAEPDLVLDVAELIWEADRRLTLTAREPVGVDSGTLAQVSVLCSRADESEVPCQLLVA